jgi:hypothetical protein
VSAVLASAAGGLPVSLSHRFLLQDAPDNVDLVIFICHRPFITHASQTIVPRLCPANMHAQQHNMADVNPCAKLGHIRC